MNKYIDGLSQIVSNESYLKLTFYAAGVFFALILVVLIGLLVKYFANMRIRKIQSFSMSFEDLEKMRRTGLISDDEYAKAKNGLIRHFQENLKSEYEKKADSSQAIPAIRPVARVSPSSASLPIPDDLVPPARQIKDSRKKPIDIDDLMAKGLISEEEYNNISNISRKKSPPK